jgi:hypothetical protein
MDVQDGYTPNGKMKVQMYGKERKSKQRQNKTRSTNSYDAMKYTTKLWHNQGNNPKRFQE